MRKDKEVIVSYRISSKKMKKRKEIEEKVFDIHDAVADNAKVISLMFYFIKEIWQALPNEVKNNINPSVRDVIEFAVAQFSSKTSWGLYQFEKEGLSLIDRLIKRQQKIVEILSEK